jgi:hypothetical protein
MDERRHRTGGGSIDPPTVSKLADHRPLVDLQGIPPEDYARATELRDALEGLGGAGLSHRVSPRASTTILVRLTGLSGSSDTFHRRHIPYDKLRRMADRIQARAIRRCGDMEVLS